MDALDKEIWEAGHYGPGGSHGIVKVPGSKWLIVDSWYEMGTSVLLGLGIHYDGDDPAREPIHPDNLLYDGESHSAALHRRHTKAVSLSLRRATDTQIAEEIGRAERYALAHLALAKERRANPEKRHVWVTAYGHTLGHSLPL